ncbi:F-box/LRR-repeat protein [Thalictrum thalictroides]|uniref:F-box/LRR-repeat protein n=1 Tax=Thalictrum thalictroides TaxID=46969 RepID=A0A7J6XD60_THATH|nr:F-box/LRR-repeat protein [Thalictrum thalictroides]
MVRSRSRSSSSDSSSWSSSSSSSSSSDSSSWSSSSSSSSSSDSDSDSSSSRSSSPKRLKTSYHGSSKIRLKTCYDNNSNDGIDRISELPDLVLHHILSFIDLQEVIVNTSLISKRWRNLWLSLPILNFDNSSISMRRSRNNIHSFTRFVDRVLLRRDNSFIKSLSICHHDYGSLHILSVEDWMIYAARKNVEQVCFDIGFDSTKKFMWPEFSKIQVFKLQATRKNLLIPHSLFLDAHLKSLSLSYVRLPEVKVLTLSCSVLENLTISYCCHKHVKILKISAPELTNLELNNDRYTINNTCKLQVSTPNLTSLLLTGTMYQGYSFENLSSLVKSKIECHEVPDNADFLRNILEGLHNVTTLELCGEFLQRNFVKSLDHHRGLLNTFVNLKCLNLGWSGGSCMHIFHSLLMNSYSLEDLVLEIDHVCKAHDWRELFPCVHRLKSFEIQAVKGSENEFKLFEFILKNAVVLEDFTIHSHQNFRNNRRKELAKFNMKIHALPRASSRVKILVL